MKSISIILLATFIFAEANARCPSNIAVSTTYDMTNGLRRQGCKTGRGASGECIIPYISIAADPSHYKMGTIIYMPSMRGKMIQLPNGTKKPHPGYFLIEDTGGAIDGKNRFDFFTGDIRPENPKNSFGSDAEPDMQLSDKTCRDSKAFKKISKKDPKYPAAVRQMRDFWKAAKLSRPDLEEIAEKADRGAAPSSSSSSGSGAQ
ncbi:3D domain-containing protein [Bdellovibrio sp. HCB209]|uniref:3D domain-containing protein n=1 Tax=Bdellovibrio sp. HCB209 TaxID=3394354 RepID=UPI0039B4CF7E